MPLQSTIVPTGQGFYELTMEGHIHRPHWVIQLFYCLAQAKVSIVSGEAQQDKPGQWTSRFVIDFSKSTSNPQDLDYSALAELTTAVERPSTFPKLTHFEMERRADRLIELRLEGPDQMGFLASILARVSGLALFPSGLDIRTVAGRIKDVIILRGIGDRGPSEAAYDALNRMLKMINNQTLAASSVAK